MTIFFGDGTSVTTAPAAGIFAAHAIVADRGSGGNGTFSSGAWRTRTLNTVVADPDGIVSVSSNRFTLQAGTYQIHYSAPAYTVDDHQTVLYNVTDGAYVSNSGGYNSHTWSNTATSDTSYGCVRVTISGAKAFEVRHQCDTSRSGIGMGRGNGTLGASPSQSQLYTKVDIFKEA